MTETRPAARWRRSVALVFAVAALLLPTATPVARAAEQIRALAAGPGPSVLTGSAGPSTTLAGTPDSADAGAGSAPVATPSEPGAASD